MGTLMRLGRGAKRACILSTFTSRIMPDASTEQADAFNDLAEYAARYIEMMRD
jgi:hypothetical protein